MARVKKSKSIKSRLGRSGKTGTKEMLKEQNKARKASKHSKFQSKKAKERKDQARKKLERLGIAPEAESTVQAPRPRRFTMPVREQSVPDVEVEAQVDSEELTTNDLLDALTETDQ
ncbi:hypothetical protein GV055_11370 [Marinomonas mediterranea]|uniref:Uncharacterized protein n=2 Tax=Marinomonas mediterranea TaxID=119864 RepID=F2JTL2_MARM1|nr:hypothetical protein Marme_2285 [Marinomonas mediterranea MMB-1]WCN11417.1 hypothetical protein GV055_11370 [Marinomonas mediterranea]WCN15490.1 hypothetical protein GV054_11370 [Marinomonas mediterranea]WCN19565.1 hypothetical protein GV053_11485 [Marinomonas mediterranea MMB-1]